MVRGLGTSGCREGVLNPNFGLKLSLDLVQRAVRAAGAAGLSTRAQGFLDNGLDGAGAAAAFGAATKAAIELLGIARKVRGSIHGVADIMVAEDVAGTNDHEVGRPLGDAS